MSKLFINIKNNTDAEVLRLKLNETESAAIERLAKHGWDITSSNSEYHVFHKIYGSHVFLKL